MDYTIEVYKADRRFKEGEVLVNKLDLEGVTLADCEAKAKWLYGNDPRYRYEFHETYVTRTNMMGGAEYQERYDTPRYCSPSSEAYWSM